jgi:hypothetical protein
MPIILLSSFPWFGVCLSIGDICHVDRPETIRRGAGAVIPASIGFAHGISKGHSNITIRLIASFPGIPRPDPAGLSSIVTGPKVGFRGSDG